MHLLCILEGRHLEYFVEKTVEFLWRIPEEPLCYRCLLKDGYRLQKVSLEAEMPKEQRKPRKRIHETKQAQEVAMGECKIEVSETNPITLEEEESKEPKEVKTVTPDPARTLSQTERKR